MKKIKCSIVFLIVITLLLVFTVGAYAEENVSEPEAATEPEVTVTEEDASKVADAIFDKLKNVDIDTLMENPTLILMVAYYILAIISVFSSIIAGIKNKSKKVKTSEEIADKVSKAGDASVHAIETKVTEVVETQVKPIMSEILAGMNTLVKAMTLSNMKGKDAPIALLELLQNTSTSSDTTELIEKAKEAVLESIKTEELQKVEDVNVLRGISETASETDVEATDSVF